MCWDNGVLGDPLGSCCVVGRRGDVHSVQHGFRKWECCGCKRQAGFRCSEGNRSGGHRQQEELHEDPKVRRPDDTGCSWGCLVSEWRQGVARFWKALSHMVSSLDFIEWVMGAIKNFNFFFFHKFSNVYKAWHVLIPLGCYKKLP